MASSHRNRHGDEPTSSSASPPTLVGCPPAIRSSPRRAPGPVERRAQATVRPSFVMSSFSNCHRRSRRSHIQGSPQGRSAQWGLAWPPRLRSLTAVAGADTLSRSGSEGAVFHMLHRFDLRMSDGLAVPLYLLPLASLLTGFLILSQRPWTRIAHTAVGLIAAGWSAWWLQHQLEWWAVGALYILLGCLVLWTPSGSRWYGRQPSQPSAPG